MIKGLIIKRLTIINIYALNIEVPKHIKQILTDQKRVINNTIIIENFNIPLSTVNKSSRQKISSTMDSNHTLDQVDLTNIYRTFHPAAGEYNSSQVHAEHLLEEVI